MELLSAAWWSALLAIVLIGLVIIGLLVSVLIVVFGSTMVLNLVERFPIIIQAGAAVLAFTAAKMIVDEPLLRGVFGAAKAIHEPSQMVARGVVYAMVVVGVLAVVYGANGVIRRRVSTTEPGPATL